MQPQYTPRSRTTPGRQRIRAALVSAATLAAAGAAQAEMPGMGFVPLTRPNAHEPFESMPLTSAHETRDLRDEGVITPAKHQGSCGACWAFAAITCVETACLLSDPTLAAASFDLSEQHLVSCDTEVWRLEFGTTRNYGCQGGSAVAFEFIRRYGIASESAYPYASGGGQNGDCPAAVPELSGWQVLDWDFVRADAGVPSVAEMKAAVDAYGAIWAGFIVYEDFIDGSGGGFWYTGGAGDIYAHGSGDRVGAHAVAVIGYDDVQQCWIAKNSWGESAGPDGDGTFRIAYSAGCNFGLNAAWVSVGYFGAPSPAVDTTWGAVKLLFAEGE